MKCIYVIILVIVAQCLFAQETFSSIVKENGMRFTVSEEGFRGEGWDEILAQVQSHDNVLIGEDHFFNEIPFFISKLSDEVTFDNLFCEIDPYMADILEGKIKDLEEEELKSFTSSFGSAFSFYALAPEFDLMKKMVRSNTKLIGTDQISIRSEGLLAAQLKEQTQSEKARAIYADIEKKSPLYFSEFMKGNGMPYFLSEELTGQLERLKKCELSPDEQSLIEDLELSQQIYLNQDHHLRIQLMKHNMLEHFDQITQSKNLFKYGAVHLPKGESLMEIQDIGTLVNNLSDGQFESSLHLMIIGQKGSQGVPFEGMENGQVDPNGEDLKSYKVFFDAMKSSEWQVFDNKKILAQLKSNKIDVEDETLERVIKGYDYLIVIPQVSAAEFLK